MYIEKVVFHCNYNAVLVYLAGGEILALDGTAGVPVEDHPRRVIDEDRKCPLCRGKGRFDHVVMTLPCSNCNGTGYLPERKKRERQDPWEGE